MFEKKIIQDDDFKVFSEFLFERKSRKNSFFDFMAILRA